jgi:hypothetical protein
MAQTSKIELKKYIQNDTKEKFSRAEYTKNEMTKVKMTLTQHGAKWKVSHFTACSNVLL